MDSHVGRVKVFLVNQVVRMGQVKWTAQGSSTGRSKRLKVDGLGQKWAVRKKKLDGPKEENWTS